MAKCCAASAQAASSSLNDWCHAYKVMRLGLHASYLLRQEYVWERDLGESDAS